nr:hypothetical protein [Vibrio pacinii]
MLLLCFAVSDANVFVESQLCNIAVPKGLFGAFSQHSTALLIPSGFSDSRFETAPDLSFSKHSKTVLAKWKWRGNQRFRMATNKAFKADSQH